MAVAIGSMVAFLVAGVFRVSSVLAVVLAIALPIAGIYMVTSGQADRFGPLTFANLFEMWWPAAAVLFAAYLVGRFFSGIGRTART
ncbi:MAG: hypothetical protein AAGF45_00800 [Pseudomonadota bacterium]